jgi:uncharacterized protein (DUF2237 family)
VPLQMCQLYNLLLEQPMTTEGRPMSANQLNVLGTDIEICGTNPKTGYYRDGCCHTGPKDIGIHTVCAIVTKEFLDYSHSQGNDLITPRPELNFPGLRPGDAWCLCAMRFKEAKLAGCAPKVRLTATNEKTLEIVSLDTLKEYQIDLN